MSGFINLENEVLRHQLAKKITGVVTSILHNWSSVEDKGRFIKGLDYSHICHYVLPEEIERVLKNYGKEDK